MVGGGENGGTAVLFTLFAYALMTLGAFAVVISIGRHGEANEDIADYAGLGLRRPLLGVCMIVFMLSLAGIPSLAGFTGKFFLFSAAIEKGYIWLVIIAALNSTVSIYYYGGVLVQMYMGESTREAPPVTRRPYLLATLLITSTGTVLLGLFPTWALELARSAVQSLG
jgi:NADH-quinone oxidoreductase subunit N